jgi:hypothetical protein
MHAFWLQRSAMRARSYFDARATEGRGDLEHDYDYGYGCEVELVRFGGAAELRVLA